MSLNILVTLTSSVVRLPVGVALEAQHNNNNQKTRVRELHHSKFSFVGLLVQAEHTLLFLK